MVGETHQISGEFMLLDGVCFAITQIYIPLMPSERRSCPPSGLPPLSRAAHNILGGARKKWVFLAASFTAEEARCSLTFSFFCGQNQEPMLFF